MNERGDCDVMFDYVFMPLYMVGPNFRKEKFETIKSNPSTGYFGVAVRRDTLGSGVVGPDGEPMPASISLLKEFDKAFARGKKGEPGFKLYEAPYKIQRGQGYPFILGLPISMQPDFTDLYGGPGATSVARLGSAQGRDTFVHRTTEHGTEISTQHKERMTTSYHDSILPYAEERGPKRRWAMTYRQSTMKVGNERERCRLTWTALRKETSSQALKRNVCTPAHLVLQTRRNDQPSHRHRRMGHSYCRVQKGQSNVRRATFLPILGGVCSFQVP